MGEIINELFHALTYSDQQGEWFTFSVTVKTRTVKTIVPYDQFPKTCIEGRQMSEGHYCSLFGWLVLKNFKAHLAVVLQRWVTEQKANSKEEEQPVEDSE